MNGAGNKRDIGYVEWTDELAPLEKMKGPLWESTIRSEQRAYSAAESLTAVRSRIKEFRAELQKGAAEIQQYFFKAGGGKIELAPGPGGGFYWRYSGGSGSSSSKGNLIRDIVADQTHAWIVTDIGAGAETLELTCISHANPKTVIWRRRGVGPSIAVSAGRCIYTLTENIHRGYAAVAVNAFTGGDPRTLVELADDPKWNIHVVRAEGGAVFIQAENSGRFKLWTADGAPLDHKSKVQVVAGKVKNEDAWIADGVPTGSIKGWPAPKESILWALPCRGYIATYMFGKTTIYKWGPSILRKVYTLPVGTALLDSWMTEESVACPVTLTILSPDKPIFTLTLAAGAATAAATATEDLPKHAITPHKTLTPLLKVKYIRGRSADGTGIPICLVGLPGVLAAGGSVSKQPKGLLVYAYGAYGISVKIGRPWALWGPLLARGWVIAYGMIRGGGDGGEEWAEAVRREGRSRAVEDLEAVVRAARKACGVTAAKTVISGRSAGGLVVGALTAKYGNGSLFGATFAEVPYVDILRTTTNPALALTTVEYDEFGDPARRIADFATIMRISPIDQVAGRGAPGVFVLARTGGNDTQVYPYEPVKWIVRLREGDDTAATEGKLLGYDADEGHFYSPAADLRARSTDLAILDAWLDSQEVRKKIADISIKAQMANTMTRKSRKNNMRKSRKTEGGRRRKASTMRKSRKARKSMSARRRSNRK